AVIAPAWFATFIALFPCRRSPRAPETASRYHIAFPPKHECMDRRKHCSGEKSNGPRLTAFAKRGATAARRARAAACPKEAAARSPSSRRALGLPPEKPALHRQAWAPRRRVSAPLDVRCRARGRSRFHASARI